jgi:N-hydroxyarylamine O-acetyltransferase
MDPEAYLRRIGYSGRRDPHVDVLSGIVRQHAFAIAFENLDAFLGRRVSLVPDEVERKLVHDGRGGWCFEQNLLLGEALRALGFDVTDLAGRVLWNRAPGAVPPRTHRALLVRIDGRCWLADVGFGGQTLTGVLDMDRDDAQQTTHEPFRLLRDGAERVLESRVQGEWKAMFRFDLQPHLPVDFEAANYQLAHDPASHFTQVLIVSRVSATGRHVLHGRELAFHDLHGGTTRRELTAADVILALREPFGLRLDPATEAALATRLDT